MNKAQILFKEKIKKSRKNKECKSAKRSEKLTTDRITFFSFIFLKIKFQKDCLTVKDSYGTVNYLILLIRVYTFMLKKNLR